MPSNEKVGPFQVKQAADFCFFRVGKQLKRAQVSWVPYSHTVIQRNADYLGLVFNLILGKFIGLEGEHPNDGSFMTILPLNRFDTFNDPDRINPVLRNYEQVRPIRNCDQPKYFGLVFFELLDSLV